jgi:hypothetical protein
MSPFLAVRSNSQEDVTETHSMCRLGGTWRPRTSANEPHECLFSDAWPELHLSILVLSQLDSFDPLNFFNVTMSSSGSVVS